MTELFLPLLYAIGAVCAVAALGWYMLVRHPRRRAELAGAFDMMLFKILVPHEEIPAPGEAKKSEPKEIIRKMEQLYAALEALRVSAWHALRYGNPSVTFELALPHVGQEVAFYAAVPRLYAAFFTSQLNSFFPSAKIDAAADYNIFHPTGVSAASYALLTKNALLALRTYKDLGDDPLEVLTGAFTKLKETGDGAAIQFVVRPAENKHHTQGKQVAQKIRAGASFKDALGGIWSDFFKAAKPPEKQSAEPAKPKQGDEELAKQIEEKASHPAFDVNIRLIASAATPDEARAILQGLEAAFLQFNNPQGNELRFERPGGRALEELMYQYSFRLFAPARANYLCAPELAGIFHVPYGGFAQPNVMYLKAREAPAPAEVPSAGLRLGKNVFRGTEKDIFISDEDRRRHLYVIGQTGTGKSTLLKDMARQDIEAGRGVCFIDPHGQDVEELMAFVPPGRVEDVIYFNPGDIERPLGLNFLEYDMRHPEQKSLIVNELLDIFNKLYNMSVAGGPMFEQYFRNATALVMEDPTSGNTLLEIPRVLADKEFRDRKLSRSANIVVNTFWQKIAEKAGGESSLQNMVPYITSKIDTFLSNDIMRPIIAQEKSAFNFRDAMDQQKILLINLSKGRLGELNSSLLGLIIVGKILMAALSRADMNEADRRDFYLYIDEFQNVTTKSIATILSEARKYRLNLIIAHQFLGQLEEEIKKAVFGNVGSMVAFRIGSDDGEYMEKQFSPVFTAKDLLNIDNWNAYVKLLIHGQTARAFNLRMYAPPAGDPSRKENIIALSRLKYGRPRADVEAEVQSRYHV